MIFFILQVDKFGILIALIKYANWIRLFKKIHLPINRSAILIAFLLCFIDIMKELPITLILRPFNFDTLAVQTYQFAIEEMIPKSAVYSLTIVMIGSILLIFLKKIVNKQINVS